jgi:RNA polymerase sigma factor (sigma-70 family)
MVEHYIDSHKEVAEAYENMQDNLELLARLNAAEPPRGVLAKIEAELNEESRLINMTPRMSKTPWYSIAASIVALVFAGSSYVLYQKNQELNSENSIVIEEIYDLRQDISNNNDKLNELADELSKLNDPDSKKYVLTGNERAKNLRTVAYINQDVIDIKKHLGTLDEKYQIVIRALYFEGLTQQEASEELNIPLGTVKSRLKIGLRELKKIYNP